MLRGSLLWFGSLLTLAGGVVYAVSILQGRSRPHRTTRLLIALVTGLAWASLVAGHDRSGVWLAGASFAEAGWILLLSLRRGMGGRAPFDLACTALCLVGAILWIATGRSLVGLLAAIFTDFLAVLPALKKMWHHPRTESWLFYVLGVIAPLAVLAAGPYGFRAVLFPAYLAAINGACAAVIIGRRAGNLNGARE